jgi:hypothetical protein
MAPLCTIEDVEALAGTLVPVEEQPRIDRLIEMASSVVAGACVTLPAATPGVVVLVTARLVVRQVANPSQASSEDVAGYRVNYGAGHGLMLTAEDRAQLGEWYDPTTSPRQGAYSVLTPSPFAYYADEAIADPVEP